MSKVWLPCVGSWYPGRLA